MAFNFCEVDLSEGFLAEWRQYGEDFINSGLTADCGLDPESVRDNAVYARFSHSEIEELLQIAARIQALEILHPLFAFCVYHLHHSPVGSGYTQWPDLEAWMGKDKNAFYMLAALTLIPVIRKKYHTMAIPEELIHDTVLQFSGFYRNHRIGYNAPGIIMEQMFWLKNYRDGILFRHGRMEFRAETFADYGMVLRQRRTGHKIMIASGGRCHDEDGYYAAPGTPGGWDTTFIHTVDTICGHAILPCGRVMAEKVTLDMSEWEIALEAGDDVIDVHIPPGGGLSLEVCRDSLLRAAAFFPALMPQRHFKAFFCHSWIFNTQLEEKMPDSNLAKFMREPYLFPVESDRFTGMFFVFSRSNINEEMLPELPRDTSLRQSMLEIVESGRSLRNGGMIYCLEDLEHFGAQYYRRNYQL